MSDETTEQLAAFGEDHGIAALLDHLGLDAFGNYVVFLESQNQALQALQEELADANGKVEDLKAALVLQTSELRLRAEALQERIEELEKGLWIIVRTPIHEEANAYGMQHFARGLLSPTQETDHG